jgi:inner membrane protein
VLAVFIAGIWKLFSKAFPFAQGTIIAYACILLHIFLDLITSYGTLIFAPLTKARYTINAIFIIDLIYTFAMIAFLICARKWKTHSRQIAMAGLCWVLLYPLTAFAANKAITRYYAQRLQSEGVSYNTIELSTEPFSPFRWKLVLEDKTSYRLAGVSTFNLSRKLEFEVYKKPPPQLVERLGQKISMLDTFLWFARYPIMRTENNPEKTRLLFNDMRFFSTVGFLRSRSEGDNAPFALVIELDKNGKPLNWQYSEPRGSVAIHYIE